MKKIKLIIVAVAMLSLVASSTAYAEGFAPGEGMYIGAFGGMATGIVQPKVETTTARLGTGGVADHAGGTFEATEGGLGLAGAEYGGMMGYGYKMGDLYAGLEGEVAWGDVEFKLTSSIDINVAGGGGTAGANNDIEYTITAGTVVSAKKEWTGGAFGRLGYYVNPNTLLSFRGGVLVSKFDVKYGTAYSEQFYGGGPSVGVSVESAIVDIDPNLSLRLGAVYTDFMTAPVSGIGTLIASQEDNGGSNSEVTGSGLSARMGIQYSFFDVNSIAGLF